VIDGVTWTPYIEVAESSTDRCPSSSSMLGDLIKSRLWRRGFQNDEEIQELVNVGVVLSLSCLETSSNLCCGEEVSRMTRRFKSS